MKIFFGKFFRRVSSSSARRIIYNDKQSITRRSPDEKTIKTERRGKNPSARYNGEIIETRKNLCEQIQLLRKPYPFEVSSLYIAVMFAI